MADDLDRFLSDADWRNIEDTWDFDALDHGSWSIDSSQQATGSFSPEPSFTSASASASALSRAPAPTHQHPATGSHTSPMGNTASSSSRNLLVPSTARSPARTAHAAPDTTQRASRASPTSAWLGHDATQDTQHMFGYYPENLWDASSPNPLSPTQVARDAEDNEMGPTGRRGRQSGLSIVDLTNDASSPVESTSQKRKREAPSSPAGLDRTAKRGKTSTKNTDPDVEEIDLSLDRPTSSITETLLRSQQEEAIRSQQTEPAGSQRVGKITCIICMEPFTNATTTVCGHPFCHECLTQALMAGEKNSDNGVGSCPVCRKPLRRNTKTKTLVPILFMKKSAFKKNVKGRSSANFV